MLCGAGLFTLSETKGSLWGPEEAWLDITLFETIYLFSAANSSTLGRVMETHRLPFVKSQGKKPALLKSVQIWGL